MQRAKTPSSSEDGLEVMEKSRWQEVKARDGVGLSPLLTPLEGRLEKEMASQCSCLENPMDPGAWWATSPWSRKESDTTE